jgi:hypothetical protein
MINEVNHVAEQYLQHLDRLGMKPTPVEHRGHSFYDGGNQFFVNRVDEEFKDLNQRYDVGYTASKFILKSNKKYFYGFKASEARWTYDIRLALSLNDIEADALIYWLDTFGTPAIKFPAPEDSNRSTL